MSYTLVPGRTVCSTLTTYKVFESAHEPYPISDRVLQHSLAAKALSKP